MGTQNSSENFERDRRQLRLASNLIWAVIPITALFLVRHASTSAQWVVMLGAAALSWVLATRVERVLIARQWRRDHP